MIDQNFSHLLSIDIVDNFLDYIQTSQLTASQKQITVVGKPSNGLRKETECKVIDYLMSLEFADVKAIAEHHHINEETATKTWTECTKEVGCGLLEIFINTVLREKGFFCDVIIRNATDSKLLCFRKSADLLTQNPLDKIFRPVYKDSFSDLQEVLQGEYAITYGNDKKPVLASWHFANCVGFVAFNEKYKIGILAHVDSIATYDSFFRDIKAIFPPDLKSPIIIEYVLVGGSEDDLRKEIRNYVMQSKEEFLEFKFIGEVSKIIPEKEFDVDSWWTSSVRLDRSIALDTRKGAFENCLMSYEPCLNADSSFRKRAHTDQETNRIEENREENSDLKKVYYSIPSFEL